MGDLNPHFYGKEGFWRGWIAITRSGVFRYEVKDADGVVTEHFWARHPEDIFGNDHLRSLIGVPIIKSKHCDPINSLNALDGNKEIVGAILGQFQCPIDASGALTHGYLKAKAVIWDQATIELARNGHGMVSEGYSFTFVEERAESLDVNDLGEWVVTKKTTGKMTKPEANHVLIVASDEKGRAGTYATVIFDSDPGAAIAAEDPESELQASEEDEPENDGGEEVEVEVAAADALNFPSSADGKFTIDNSSDPTFKMLRMVANAASIVKWLYITPHMEITPGNIARMIINAINWEADIPENDDMAIMKAELLLETINTAWDSDDVVVRIDRVGDSQQGKLRFTAKVKNELVNESMNAIAAPGSQGAPEPSSKTTLTPLPALTKMASDSRASVAAAPKTDRTSSLRKGWK